jgi:hypothetical protein
MNAWEILYLLNIFCVWFSWRVAKQCFDRGDKAMGYVNVFASALNAAVVLNHFL